MNEWRRVDFARLKAGHEIHESDYRNENYHVDRYGQELHVTLTYPNVSNGGALFVVFDQESVRASDGIRISYDYDRDGYKIEQASIFQWEIDDEVCDPDWEEVAFIQAWAREKNGPNT